MTSTHPPAADGAEPSPPLLRESVVMAVYDSHLHAAHAIERLQRAGLDMRLLSMVGQHACLDGHAVGLCASGDRVVVWGGHGAFWAGMWGLFVGGAIFSIPVIGHVVVLGPIVGWLVSALEGPAAAGARGVFGEVLAGAGIPDASVIKYLKHLETGRYLVMVRGSAVMGHDARWVLDGSGASSVSCHEPA